MKKRAVVTSFLAWEEKSLPQTKEGLALAESTQGEKVLILKRSDKVHTYQ
jgi:hypothetical protein